MSPVGAQRGSLCHLAVGGDQAAKLVLGFTCQLLECPVPLPFRGMNPGAGAARGISSTLCPGAGSRCSGWLCELQLGEFRCPAWKTKLLPRSAKAGGGAPGTGCTAHPLELSAAPWRMWRKCTRCSKPAFLSRFHFRGRTHHVYCPR